jgi:Uma2 family endonuclease
MSDAVNREVTQAELDDLETMIRESSEIIAEGVSYDDFLNTDYGDFHVEWAYGMVLKMPPIDLPHNLCFFINALLQTYFDLREEKGLVLRAPALMRTVDTLPRRVPDIQVLLPENTQRFKNVETVGAADLVVEVTTRDSERTDRNIKFFEYEWGGVLEYWVIDPAFKEILFFQRNEAGLFDRVAPNEKGRYQSKSLPGFSIPVRVLWDEDVTHVSKILSLVEDMLKES